MVTRTWKRQVELEQQRHDVCSGSHHLKQSQAQRKLVLKRRLDKDSTSIEARFWLALHLDLVENNVPEALGVYRATLQAVDALPEVRSAGR